MQNVKNIISLSTQIARTHHFFKSNALRQVNNSLTHRNWLVGYYIVEFEQKGEDRAEYGEKILLTLSNKLVLKFRT